MVSNALVIYTDGSCSPNPGPGGWGFISILPDVEFHINGGERNTTNNKMELTAVIEALKFHSDTFSFVIYSDSKYVINCAKGKWKRKKNLSLWERYNKVSKGRKVMFEWVRGHSGDMYNEKVDFLAKEGAQNQK